MYLERITPKPCPSLCKCDNSHMLHTLVCSMCPTTKVSVSHPLPPNLLLKGFGMRGWKDGGGEMRRKRALSTLSLII